MTTPVFYLRKLLSPDKRKKLKKLIRKAKMKFNPRVKKQTKEELYRLLTETFHLKQGDKIFVSSSFGNLCAADFTPKDLIQMLKEIVGEEGTIMMPYYPPLNSSAWAKSGQLFDMVNTKSSMGIVTNLFSKEPGVIKSIHPTKAVCVWGKDAAFFAEGHDKEKTTPFYKESPYGKFLNAGSKSLALGIGRMPMIHCVEDIISDNPSALYVAESAELGVITSDSSKITVVTKIHDDMLMSKCIISVRFIEKHNCPTLRKQRFGADFCYLVNNSAVKELMTSLYKQNITRLSC